jgi:hypothetical protein
MDRITAACAELVSGRYLLARDVAAVSRQAAAQWDYYMSPAKRSEDAAAVRR